MPGGQELLLQSIRPQPDFRETAALRMSNRVLQDQLHQVNLTIKRIEFCKILICEL
jgi:hypothetical protein